MSLLGALLVSAVLTAGLTSRTAWPRLVVEQFPGPVRRAIAVVVLTLTLAVTAILPLSRIGHPAPMIDIESMSVPELFLGHAILAGCLLAWWALAGCRPLPAFLHFRLDRPREQIKIGVVAGLGGWAVTMLVMALTGALLGVGADAGAAGGVEPEIPEMVRAIVGLSIPMRLALVCSAGFFEELFFRSFLQARGGLLLSTILFTASHASYGMPLMLVGVFTVSIVLGRVFARRGDVVPCMVAHAVFDAVQLFVILPVVVANG